jgi:large subunit ribosomal protein L29
VRPAEIRALSDAELLNELENAEQRLFNLHFQRTTQNLESTAELAKTRKDIARLRTIVGERQRAQAATAAATEPDRASES